MADTERKMQSPQTSAAPGQVPARVLIVDDDPSIVKLLELVLTTNNFSVKTAVNGAEAISVIENADSFDLVFLDMLMPVMNGYDFLCWFRNNYPDTPVVVFTSLLERDVREKLVLAGATDIQRKPVSFETILALAHNMTREREIEI